MKMITANINFLTNNFAVDLTCRNSELRAKLNSAGVLMQPNMIPLNNTMTLKVHLIPDDNIGEMLCGIVNTNKDTLGSIQQLCRHFYCLNSRHKEKFAEKLQNGEITSIEQGIFTAQKMREIRKAEYSR